MLYATYNDRLLSLIDNLPLPHSNTEIIIIHQTSGIKSYNTLLDKIAGRNDIRYFNSKNKGVTKSRNLAMKKATGEILLFCDDDITYQPGFQDKIIQTFSEKNLGFVTFAYKNSPNSPGMGKFPLLNYKHTLRTILSVGTIQIACIKHYVDKYNITFPEDMGAGNTYFLCDEPVFLSQFIKNNIQGEYEPYILCFHPDVSSGSVFNNINAFRSRYLCFTRIFGNVLGRFIYILYLLKNIKHFSSFGVFLSAIKLGFIFK
ncbi:glycosyltransferase family 2 protein [Providencia stuartii]|uniref:glycosyltransferase family 2 protein n=1 Tax=Providencia TaxID=586 RepID=UPI00076B6FF2|nr:MULTISPECIES: glycosyltransferase family 2 protein [Providencia]AMG67611.1 hypothetical protein AL507_14020 [Providencia stuartii]